MRPYDTGHHTHVNVTALDGGAIMDVPMERLNAAKNAALWVLKILLAAIFLLVGIQKLIGRTAWVDLFAMAGYPEWFRTVVGAIETVCGIALLIPAVASYAAITLAVVMFGATFTQLVSGGGWAALASLALLIALVAVARLRWSHALHETRE
jgi:putative oxidoreductase